MKVKAICIENHEPLQRWGSEIKRYNSPIEAYKAKGLTYNITIGKIYTITIPEWADTEGRLRWQRSLPYLTGHKPSYEELKNRFENMVGLKDDTGEEILIPQDFFKLIDEHRQEQIDQILK